MTQTKTVYILLTRSGTWFSRLIHLATDDCYTHASIGLDGPAGPFYSFAVWTPALPCRPDWSRSGWTAAPSAAGRLPGVSVSWRSPPRPMTI